MLQSHTFTESLPLCTILIPFPVSFLSSLLLNNTTQASTAEPADLNDLIGTELPIELLKIHLRVDQNSEHWLRSSFKKIFKFGWMYNHCSQQHASVDLSKTNQPLRAFSPSVVVLKLHRLIETVKLFYKHQQKSTSCKTSMQLRILGNVVCTTPYWSSEKEACTR